MYRIKEENIGQLTYVKTSYYSEILGLTPVLLYQLFGGKATTKLSTAKGIISIAYSIPLTDEKMGELLEKHFTKVK